MTMPTVCSGVPSRSDEEIMEFWTREKRWVIEPEGAPNAYVVGPLPFAACEFGRRVGKRLLESSRPDTRFSAPMELWGIGFYISSIRLKECGM